MLVASARNCVAIHSSRHEAASWPRGLFRQTPAVDVNTRSELGRSAIGPGLPEISDIELTRDGRTLYAVQGRRLIALDPMTLALRSEVALNGDGTRIAVDRGGRTAAVVLASGRVAVVSLARNALLRHVKLAGAVGVAIDRNGPDARQRRRAACASSPQVSRVRARRGSRCRPAPAAGWRCRRAEAKLVVGAAAGGIGRSSTCLAAGCCAWPPAPARARRPGTRTPAGSTSPTAPAPRLPRQPVLPRPPQRPCPCRGACPRAPRGPARPGPVSAGTEGPDLRSRGPAAATCLQGLSGRRRPAGAAATTTSCAAATAGDVLEGGSVRRQPARGEIGDYWLSAGSGQRPPLRRRTEPTTLHGGTGNDPPAGRTTAPTRMDGGDGDDTHLRRRGRRRDRSRRASATIRG